MALDKKTLVAARNYVDLTADSLGAVKGAPCTIKSITEVDGGQKITFEWTGTDGTKQTSSIIVKDGVGIAKVEKIKTVGLVDTYRMTFTDNSTFDYEVKNGKDGTGGEGASTWSEISDKPFETLSTDFAVEDGELKVIGGTGSGEENTIESISVNGVNVAPDENKNVDITVPDAYDDTVLSNRIKIIEDDYAKSSDIPSLSGYATETYVTEQISNIPSVDLTDYAKKNEIPDVSGYITEEQLLAKDYADKAYVTEEIAKASTGGEIDLSAYLSKVEATETYVTKESGKSLISDTEIERLAGVDNYDDTQVKTQIQTVANGLMDSVGYSADYKSIDIIAKNSEKKSIDVAPIISHASITELSDVDTTNKATGKALVYNAITSKHEYVDVSGTDEKVKLSSTSVNAHYLDELIDNSTIEVDTTNNCLVAKKIDGQTATVAEINFLTGVTSNIQDQINNLGKSMRMYGVFNTKADLLASTTPVPTDGNVAIITADEDNNNKQMTYIYIDNVSKWVRISECSITVRDFTTNPIDLDKETTGILPKEKIDAAIARLADVLDKITYGGSADGIVKQADTLTGLTATIAQINQAIDDSHTHPNISALNDIINNGLGNKYLADDGKYVELISISSTAPTSTYQLWVDIANANNPVLKIHDGTNWITISGGNSGSGLTDDEKLKLNEIDNKLKNKADVSVIGDINNLIVVGVTDLVSAVNKTSREHIQNINLNDNIFTVTYKNGTTTTCDLSSLISNIKTSDLSNIDDSTVTDKQVLAYDSASNKYIPYTIDSTSVLQDAKDYTDKKLSAINGANKLVSDSKPTYDSDTKIITYEQNGKTLMTTDTNTWFYYKVDSVACQTIFISGIEFTIEGIANANFTEYVNKNTDVASTYTGNETDTSKIPNIAAMKVLQNILNNLISAKVNTSDIIDDLLHTDSDKPLSGNQGRELRKMIEDVSINISGGASVVMKKYLDNVVANTQYTFNTPLPLNDCAIINAYNVESGTANQTETLKEFAGYTKQDFIKDENFSIDDNGAKIKDEYTLNPTFNSDNLYEVKISSFVELNDIISEVNN